MIRFAGVFLFLFFLTVQLHSAGTEYQEAIRNYNNGLYGRSAQIFRQYINSIPSDHPDRETALYFLAKSKYYLNEYAEAADLFARFIREYPLSSLKEQVYNKLGLHYFESGEYSRSREMYYSLLNEFPGSEYSGSAQYWIGESFVHEGKFDEAISYLENAISSRAGNKYSDFAIFSLAGVYERKGDYKSAVTYYDELISFYRGSQLLAAAQIRIGYCYFRLKDYDASILELSNPNIGTMDSEKQAEALYLLANAMYHTSDYEGAYKIYADIQNKFPSVSFIRDLRYAFAWTNFRLKKYADAYKFFNSVSETEDSMGIEAFFWKGEAKRYTGNLAEALKIYEQFLLKFPNSEKVQGVRYQLGLISYSDKKYEQAVKFLVGSVSGKDRVITVKSYILLGEIELYRKKYQLADNYFASVISMNPADISLVYRARLGSAISSFHQEKYKITSDILKQIENDDPNFEFEKVSFFLAEALFNQGKYKDAIAYYNKISTEDKQFGNFALYGKAYAYYNQADYKNAAFLFSDFQKLFKNDERADDALLRLGDSYFAIKDYDSAVKTYRDILARKSKSVRADYVSYQLALAYYRAGKIKESLTELNSVSALYSRSEYGENAVYLAGWIHFQQGNYSAAIDKYLLMLNTMPRSRLIPMVLYSIGDSYFNLGSYDSSIAYYSRIITSHAGSSYLFDAINGIQYCYIAKGDLAGAAQIIDRYARQYKARDFADELFLKKGEIYYTNADYQSAITYYNEFIDLFSGSPLTADAFFWIAKSYRNTGMVLEAKQTFRALVDRYPSAEVTVSAVVELVSLYQADNNNGEALKVINSVMSNFTKSARYPELLYTKAKLLLVMNDVGGAYDLFDETSVYFADNLFGDKSKIELGRLEMMNKRYKKAAEVLLKVTSKRTDDLAAEAQYILGLVYTAEGRSSEAVTAFVRVTNIFSLYDEWVTKSYLRLGELYEKSGDKNKAREMYKNVLAKHPDDEYGKEAQAKLRKLK
ncbi:MAG: tetratricopeptide repeat protein [Ignavibacteriaceae bacterium]|nr:tetratricopeptide repeat protein [Ignavibacteriaceae bacterium]